MTSRAQINIKRGAIVESFFHNKNIQYKSYSEKNFGDLNHKIHIVCPVSNRRKTTSAIYWYSVFPNCLEFIKKAEEGYFILGCMDKNEAYALPRLLLENNLRWLSKTDKDKDSYWHITLCLDSGRLAWNISKVRKKIDLRPYTFPIRKI